MHGMTPGSAGVTPGGTAGLSVARLTRSRVVQAPSSKASRSVKASRAPALLEVTGTAALHASATDHGEMVEAMRRLSTDAELREKLRAAGLERAREFSWAACARATLDVYREAAS